MKTSKGSKFKSKDQDSSGDNALKNTAKAIMEQAEQIWLAGLGAFAKRRNRAASSTRRWSRKAQRWNAPHAK